MKPQDKKTESPFIAAGIASRALWIDSPGRCRILEQPLPAGDPGELLIRALYSGISRGTEALVFSGRVPESQHQVMRAPFQQGRFDFPVKYGYASVGRVEQGPPDRLGQTVFCLHPHQDVYRVPADQALALPADVPPRRAVLAANMETAVNALWDASPGIGDRISVIGAGVVGTLCACLAASIAGSRVTLIDNNPERTALATHFGLAFAAPEDAPGDQDLVLHASGDPAGLQRALELAGFEARIIELSWYGEQSVGLPLGQHFHAGRLTLRSSQVGHLPPRRQARWNHRRRMCLALALLADPRFDALISGETAFDALPRSYARILDPDHGELCHRVVYPAVA
ncbi:MAG: zinc-binding alcohol dehydrogenase [Wenzhouxiangellaceae bacterium]|nr:zinc-binding alcohol dehydrogenase [Wenzhouxiangellaceae bacterium]